MNPYYMGASGSNAATYSTAHGMGVRPSFNAQPGLSMNGVEYGMATLPHLFPHALCLDPRIHQNMGFPQELAQKSPQELQAQFALHHHHQQQQQTMVLRHADQNSYPMTQQPPEQVKCPSNALKRKMKSEEGLNESLVVGQSSYSVFMKFVKFNGTETDASAMLSSECFRAWVATRRAALKQPEESFRRTLIAHLTGSDRRRPFPADVERSLLEHVRKQAAWPCFTNTKMKIGLQGFRAKGYHERQRENDKDHNNVLSKPNIVQKSSSVPTLTREMAFSPPSTWTNPAADATFIASLPPNAMQHTNSNPSYLSQKEIIPRELPKQMKRARHAEGTITVSQSLREKWDLQKPLFLSVIKLLRISAENQPKLSYNMNQLLQVMTEEDDLSLVAAAVTFQDVHPVDFAVLIGVISLLGLSDLIPSLFEIKPSIVFKDNPFVLDTIRNEERGNMISFVPNTKIARFVVSSAAHLVQEIDPATNELFSNSEPSVGQHLSQIIGTDSYWILYCFVLPCLRSKQRVLVDLPITKANASRIVVRICITKLESSQRALQFDAQRVPFP